MNKMKITKTNLALLPEDLIISPDYIATMHLEEYVIKFFGKNGGKDHIINYPSQEEALEVFENIVAFFNIDMPKSNKRYGLAEFSEEGFIVTRKISYDKRIEEV